MDLPTLFLLLIIAIFFFAILFIIIALQRSYKNDVRIARQSGKDTSDVIWIQDKFRVMNRNGAWVIEFKKLREKTGSIDGKLWHKLLKKESHNKFLSFTKDKWDSMDMSSHIKRGLVLYETTEGEFYPMTIKKDDTGKFMFSVLDQDNRQFVINEIQSINDLTRNKKQEVALLWGIVVGFVVLAVTFMVFMYFMNKGYQGQLAEMGKVCSNYAYAVVNMTSQNNPTFLQGATKILGG